MRKILLIIILLSIEMPFCFCQDTEEEIIFIPQETMPKFENGEMDDFLLWTYKNLKYPGDALKKSISGNAYVRFLIDSTGTLKNLKVLRSTSSILDNEVLRVLEIAPKFIPAKLRGKNIGVPFTIPIEFNLNDIDFKMQIEKLEENESNMKKHSR